MHIAVWLTSAMECFRFSEANRLRLQAALPQSTIAVCADADQFKRELPRADVALIWRFDQTWFALAPRLKWISTPAAGRDYFSVTPPPGVRLTYGTFHGQIMAETVVAMMLAHCRGILAVCRCPQSDLWPRAAVAAVGRPLRGSHAVILGFGHIGHWIARLLKPFGVRITGVKRSPGEAPEYFEKGDRVITVDHLDQVLPDTDHLIVCLPGHIADTTDIVNAHRLTLLPPHAVVYNVGRGNAIDEAALAEALHSGRIAGACLDVFKDEPLPADSPLRRCPNLLIFPHSSAIAPNYMDLFIDELVKDLKLKA